MTVMDTIDGQPRDYTSNRNPLVVLVCGVDIVGSTRNKMDNPNGWYFDVTEFFDVFDQKLRIKIRGMVTRFRMVGIYGAWLEMSFYTIGYLKLKKYLLITVI